MAGLAVAKWDTFCSDVQDHELDQIVSYVCELIQHRQAKHTDNVVHYIYVIVKVSFNTLCSC